MDLHISVHSKAPISRTNLRDCDVKVVPYNVNLEKRAKLALGDCIHSNEHVHIKQCVEICFNIHMFKTTKNLPYTILQLIKDGILTRRLDTKSFFKRVAELDPPLDKKRLLDLFVRLRFFYVMKNEVYSLCIKRHGFWDVHFIRSLYEPMFCLHEALTEPKQTRFLWQNMHLCKPNITHFLKTMIANKIAFSSNMKTIGSYLQFGQISFAWSFAMENDPKEYIALRGEFDKDALLIWHMILLDDYLEECKFIRVFGEEIDAFKHIFGLDHLKRQLVQIPDMWYRGVPEQCKEEFKL